ncbi:hypothetical protein GQX74_012637 [Glossina fuscipes]|nr:hypothetical protein GQX74_012637 [Glossina fuscipes]
MYSSCINNGGHENVPSALAPPWLGGLIGPKLLICDGVAFLICGGPTGLGCAPDAINTFTRLSLGRNGGGNPALTGPAAGPPVGLIVPATGRGGTPPGKGARKGPASVMSFKLSF